MKIQNNQFLSIEQLQDQFLQQTKKSNLTQDSEKSGLTFQDILNQQTGQTEENSDIKFSKHATNRLAERNIELTDSQMERLNEGTQKASEKGIKESLVLVDQLAFIVNVPNNTVVTAMEQAETDKNVFTNIDGAVII